MMSNLKSRIVDADAKQSGLITRHALALSVRATFPLLDDIEVEALVGLCAEVPQNEDEEEAEAAAIQKECKIFLENRSENGSETKSVSSGGSQSSSRSSLVSRPESRGSAATANELGPESSYSGSESDSRAGSDSSSSSDSDDNSDSDDIDEGLEGEALVLAVKKRREKHGYPHELVAYGTLFEADADQRVLFIKTLIYLHLSSCIQFKADMVKLIKMSAMVPVQGPYRGKSVITLRMLRKCIATVDPMRPEDSVIGVVEALHKLACRVCDHEDEEDDAEDGEDEDEEEEEEGEKGNGNDGIEEEVQGGRGQDAKERGGAAGQGSGGNENEDSEDGMKKKNKKRNNQTTTTTAKGQKDGQTGAVENSNASKKTEGTGGSKGKAPTSSETSIVLGDSGHLIPLVDLMHVLQWCGCINRRFDWIQ